MLKIKEVSKLASISTRTLRYYDTIDLLHPSFIGDNNYRYYSDEDIDKLQRILILKKTGLSLEAIKHILNEEEKDIINILEKQKQKLKKQVENLNQTLKTIEKTIRKEKGEISMSNKEKFEGLQEAKIRLNEEKYGKEIREKYGDEVIEETYEKMRKLSKYEQKKSEELRLDINKQIVVAMKTNDTKSEEATKLCAMHQEWIKIYWTVYSTEAHLGLCKMYLEDDRFKEYYEKVQVGATQFLYEAMKHYLK